MESRRMLAETVRRRLSPVPGCPRAARVEAVAGELEALADQLEDDRLVLDPARAVQCLELITGFEDSPLLNQLLPAEDVSVQLRQIRAGFRPAETSLQEPASCPR